MRDILTEVPNEDDDEVIDSEAEGYPNMLSGSPMQPEELEVHPTVPVEATHPQLSKISLADEAEDKLFSSSDSE